MTNESWIARREQRAKRPSLLLQNQPAQELWRARDLGFPRI